MKSVCHMTSAHPNTDIRIYYKECCSLKKHGYDVYLTAPGESCVRDGIHIIGVPDVKGRLSRMFFSARNIYKAALKIDADVYHFHDPELLRYGLKLKKRGKVVIYDSHEDVPRQIYSKQWLPALFRPLISHVFEWFENRAVRRLSGVITATPFIAARFSQIHSNTVDINNYPLLDTVTPGSASFDKRKRQFCYTGLLSKIRGSDIILDAVSNVDVSLVLAGPIASDAADLESSLPENAQYVGVISKEQVAQLYKECIGGIILYRAEPNHVNAQPNKLFEYMSAGLPVVASDFPLWKEIVDKNDCGICVDPTDIDATRQALAYLADHPAEAEEMGRKGRKAAVEKYNWKAEEKKLLDFYCLLLGKDDNHV